MHHALHIEEILFNIFGHCYILRHRYLELRFKSKFRYANADLAALARTCTAFKEPALDMIWAELDNLTPLVRCLPGTVWVVSEGVYSLNKCLEQNEWNIILGYAQRVRALPYMRHSFGLSVDCIEALSNPPDPVRLIFPNLRAVGLYAPNTTTVPLLRHLAPPNLTKIQLDGMKNLGVAAEAFGERCPFVTNFNVLQSGNADTISNLICHWDDLHFVGARKISLTFDAILHLSRLRNLHCISFRVHDMVVDRICASQFPTSTLTFSALESVGLTSHSLTQIWRLLHRFTLPALRTISIVHPAPRLAASDLLSFFMALQDACTPDLLNHLALRAFHLYDVSSVLSSEDAPTHYLTFDRLRPLTMFANIKDITLNIPCGLDLDERELLGLASSWPHLEKFEVGEDHDWTSSTAITLGGFLQLLERCRSLRALSFVFDTRGYNEIQQGHPWRGLTMPDGASIHVLNSPIEEESIEALGVFFHVAPYPNFNLTTHWNNDYFRGSERPRELCDLYYSRWVKARSLAWDMWKKRWELRCSLEDQRSR